MRICIDPGHGGHDSGAVGPAGLTEAAAVLSISGYLWGGLENGKHSARMTRESDVYLTLQERCDFAHSMNADLFLSIHANAADSPQANGFEVWTSPGWTPADPFATGIFNSVRESFVNLRGRVDSSDGDPDKESKFYVLMHTKMPAVLIETAFISNPVEEEKLTDPGWRMRMAGAIVSSIWRM